MRKIVSYISYASIAILVGLLLFTPIPLSSAALSAIERWVAEPILLPMVAGLSVVSGTVTRRLQMRQMQKCEEFRAQMKAIYRQILEAYCEGGVQ